MLDHVAKKDVKVGEYVEFVTAGTAVAGAYHCSECGYGVTVHAELPQCPMCSGTTWELNEWSPFSRGPRPLQ